MKTYCQKCDYPNDLGHLFCVKCGVKLELENVKEDIEADGQLDRTKSRFLFVLLIGAVVVIGLVVIALWPGKPARREGAAEGNIDAAEAALSRLQMMAESSRQPFTNQPLKEEDINAWLAAACSRAGAHSITVSLKPERCTVNLVLKAGPWTLFSGKKTVGPIPYSRDFSLGVTSNGLVATGAKIGHLPMVGPLVKIVADSVAKRFSDFTRERLVMSRITEVKVEDGQITVVVVSPP